MGALPTIYTARSEAPAEHQDRVDDWYVHRHAPDLLRAGFYSAQVYHAEVGSPLVCNLYEIPGHDLFQTQPYRDVAAKDTEGPPLIALLTGRSNTAYDQLVTVGIPAPIGDWSRGDRTGGVDAPAISTVRFDLPEGDERALLEWYERGEGPRLRSRRGFRAGRVCRRGPPHPVAASRDPGWFVINEWDDVGAALADGLADAAEARYAAAFPGRLSGFLYDVGRRTLRLP